MAAWLSRERRLTFGGVAEHYEEARPSYPRALVEETLAYADVSHAESILEVGAGTGKATRLFLATGRRVVAVEPSAEMASVARRTCAPYHSVTIVESDFECWPAPQERFKLLISGQAWHWVDQQTRYLKARAVLQRGGALAVFWNHVDWTSCGLRAAIDAAYREAAPELRPTGPMDPRMASGDLVPDWDGEIERAEGFENPEVRTYSWDGQYTASDYVRLLSTHSDHIVLDEVTRTRLFDRVESVITDHGGMLDLPYLTRLCLARTV